MDWRRIALWRSGKRLQERLCRALAAGWGLAGAAAHLLHCAAGAQIRQFTLPDCWRSVYNQTARVLGTIAILFAYVGIASYQFTGGGNVCT